MFLSHFADPLKLPLHGVDAECSLLEASDLHALRPAWALQPLGNSRGEAGARAVQKALCWGEKGSPCPDSNRLLQPGCQLLRGGWKQTTSHGLAPSSGCQGALRKLAASRSARVDLGEGGRMVPPARDQLLLPPRSAAKPWGAWPHPGWLGMAPLGMVLLGHPRPLGMLRARPWHVIGLPGAVPEPGDN